MLGGSKNCLWEELAAGVHPLFSLRAVFVGAPGPLVVPFIDARYWVYSKRVPQSRQDNPRSTLPWMGMADGFDSSYRCPANGEGGMS